MGNKAGELGEDQDVKDFECPGICTCSVSYRLLPEGFKQISDVSKSFFFFFWKDARAQRDPTSDGRS